VLFEVILIIFQYNFIIIMKNENINSIMRITGTYQTLGGLDYFIPHALPPRSPALALTPELMSVYGEASFSLGQLNEMSARLPDANRFIKAYVIKEALMSSAIEGIHTTLMDVFSSRMHEKRPNKDTQLVLNYTKALEVALKMLREENFPLVSRVILKAHEALLAGGEGDHKTPGSYRKQSVRVGDLVPPPAPDVIEMIGSLEKYINEPDELPALIRAGLVHVQFETIHPFLDGNGRIGRLLIVLMLLNSGLLKLPVLYPSLFFKKNHLEYHQRLNSVRTKGDFEGWIAFYLQGIHDSAIDAYQRAKSIEDLEEKIKHKIKYDDAFYKVREISNDILECLFMHPVTSVTELSKILGKAYNTISSRLQHFSELGIVSPYSINEKNTLYRFDSCLNLLEKDFSTFSHSQPFGNI